MKPLISHLVLSFSMTLLASFIYAQEIYPIYFDENFSLADKNIAHYGGKSAYVKGKWNISFYELKSGSLKLKAEYVDETFKIRDGQAVFFDSLGNEEWKGVYHNGKEKGFWMAYQNTVLTDSILYEDGIDVLSIHFTYHFNGKLASRQLVELRKKYREFSSWDLNGRLETHAHWTDGNGERKTYWPSGKVGKIDEYKNNKIFTTKYYKEDGTEMTGGVWPPGRSGSKIYEVPPASTTTTSNTTPSYPGGWAGFNAFFNRNFKVPASLGRDGFSDIVTVTFYLDKAGFAYNIRVSGSNNRDLETEVRTVFRRMAAWNMYGHKSWGPITYTLALN